MAGFSYSPKPPLAELYGLVRRNKARALSEKCYVLRIAGQFSLFEEAVQKHHG
jgi:hypothetical protein